MITIVTIVTSVTGLLLLLLLLLSLLVSQMPGWPCLHALSGCLHHLSRVGRAPDSYPFVNRPTPAAHTTLQ